MIYGKKRYVFYCLKAKIDNWLYINNKKSYFKSVNNINNPCVLKKVSMLGLIGFVLFIKKNNITYKLFLNLFMLQLHG